MNNTQSWEKAARFSQKEIILRWGEMLKAQVTCHWRRRKHALGNKHGKKDCNEKVSAEDAASQRETKGWWEGSLWFAWDEEQKRKGKLAPGARGEKHAHTHTPVIGIIRILQNVPSPLFYFDYCSLWSDCWLPIKNKVKSLQQGKVQLEPSLKQEQVSSWDPNPGKKHSEYKL